MKQLKNGFTLVELLVVMGIVGILAAALTTQMPRVRESARAMRCKANLRNLAQAAMSDLVSRASDANDDKSFTRAASFEVLWKERSGSRMRKTYVVRRGWVSWASSSGAWPWNGEDKVYDSPEGGSMTRSTFYGEKMSSSTPPVAYLSLTNGTLWALVGKDINTYVCDTHRAAAERKTGKKVYRSYVMNGVYGFNFEKDQNKDPGHGIDSDVPAANRLMFAELPARESWLSNSLSTEGADSVLDSSKKEYVGFNHKVGKRYAAHVAFADGHVEALLEPIVGDASKPSDSDLEKLTQQLCAGEEIDVDLRTKMK